MNIQVFWHSSAHVMGEAMERYCGGHLCYGPPISEGFYYDMFLQEKTISQEDFPKLEELIKCAVKVILPLILSQKDSGQAELRATGSQQGKPPEDVRIQRV